MPDAPHEKLSYSRGVLEKIRASYDKLSRDELLDLLCYLSKTYIVEQTIPFDIPIPERDGEPDEPLPDGLDNAQRNAGPEVSPAARFARLIEGLKKRAQLPQLEQFAIEDGRAVLTVDNQKIVFGERVTVEFVPIRGRPRPPGDRPSPEVASEPERAPEPPPPGARPGLPGGDGRMRQGGPAPVRPEPARPPGAPAPARPAPVRDEPFAPQTRPKPGVPAPRSQDKNEKSADLTDVDHIVERFRRLDLD